MARPRYGRDDRPRPEALPPADRPVGQLVAEALRLYGRRFWASLALGIAPAAVAVVLAALPRPAQVPWALAAGAAAATASYLGAVRIASGRPLERRAAVTAFAVGIVVFVPAIMLYWLLILPAAAWLALVGLSVPAAALERRGFRSALARGIELGRADYLHAFGALATLVLVALMTTFMLFFLLRGQAETTLATAAFLALLVVSPVVFLGAALLYDDQAARVGAAPRRSRSASSGRERERSLRIGSPSRRRRDADVRDAVDPDPAGRPDAEVQP